ncbi:hypothetical protein KKA08_09635 [bacterium]|nr:hypothetical protein [bacterium]
MPHYAITSLVAFILIFSLGLITLVTGRRDRISVSFALFCFSWSIISLLSVKMQNVPPADEMPLHWARSLPVFAFLTGYLAVRYIFTLTGYIDRLHEKFLFFRWRWYLRAYEVMVLALAIHFYFSDSLVKGVVFNDITGYSLVFAYRVPFIIWPYGLIDFMALIVLLKGYRETGTITKKTFIRHSIIGLAAVKVAAVIFVIILPQFGVHANSFAFDMFALVALYFFAIIIRYQFSQIEELNIGLEQKVQERTAALQQAQARLVQSEKMAALGNFIAGVAHEMNNPIGAARSMHDSLMRSVAVLKKKIKETAPEIENDLEVQKAEKIIIKADSVIKSSTIRVSEIVERMKRFAKLDEADVQELDLHQGIDDALTLLHAQFEDRIQIIKKYGEIKPITCNARQINQVFLNLLINAGEAITGRGTVLISTFNKNGSVCISISDDGMGIPKDKLEHVFDPGYTTKGVGVGTGLGLAICYQIIQDHQGEILVESAAGQGTTFTVALPVK